MTESEPNESITITLDQLGFVNTWGRDATKFLGYHSAEIQDQHLLLLLANDAFDDSVFTRLASQDNDSDADMDVMLRAKTGELVPAHMNLQPTANDNEPGQIVCHLRPNNAAIKPTLKIAPTFDTLTNLPNRSLFVRLMDQRLNRIRNSNDHAGVLVLQIQRLHSLERSMGADIADRYRQQIANRLCQTLRSHDTVALVGHDKFAVGIAPMKQRQDAWVVAEKLRLALAEPVLVDQHSLYLDTTIGIALCPDNGNTAHALLRGAELAGIRAFENNSTHPTFFTVRSNNRVSRQNQAEQQLRYAITADQLTLHYNPLVSLRSGRIVGADTLLRWQHPEQGLIGPEMFLSSFKETYLSLELSNWMVEAACKQLDQWRKQGVTVPPITIPVSDRQFDLQLPDYLERVMGELMLSAEQIKLKISESLMMRGADQVVPILDKLVAMGFGIVLDEFGTGYSSLAYLKRLPICGLKIDRTFVNGITYDNRDCAIIRAIVAMGRQFRYDLVAGGVETGRQMQFLRNLGCDQMQGGLFSAPVDADSFVAMVQQDILLDLDQIANQDPAP